jgi:hypothetical protein
MRILHFLGFAATVTLTASACADPSIAPANLAGNTVRVQAGASGIYRLTPDEALHMRGRFKLDDGRMLTVTNQRSKLFVELDGQKEELVQVGPSRFVARDSGTGIAFDRVPYADEVKVDQAQR